MLTKKFFEIKNINMQKTELEIKIEAWWDNLTNHQQNLLDDKYFKETNKHLDRLENLVECYNSLSKDELLLLSGIQED
jgi:hypothetical protein